MNYYKGSFLDYDKEGFDIIVGNPPYSSDNYKKHFYVKFFNKSFNILKNKSYLTFISPSRYVIQPEFKHLRNIIEDISIYCYLKNTGRSFGNISFTTVITTLVLNKNKTDKLNINWYSGLGDTIVEKILNNNLKRLFTIRSKSIIKNKKERDSYPDIKTDEYKWKYFVNSKGNKKTPFRYLDRKIINTFKPKIVTTEFVGTGKRKTLGKPLIDYNGEWGLATDSTMVIYSNNKNELDNLYSYFTSKLMNYLISVICQSSHVNQTMRLIPNMTLYLNNITDQKLYEYFNLNKEEINLIENELL